MRTRSYRTTTLSLASITLGALALVSPASPASAATSWDVVSPDGAVSASVALSDGALSLTTGHGGTSVVKASGLGLVTSAGDLSAGLSVSKATRRAVRGGYRMLTGKRAQRTVDENELTLAVTNAGGQSMRVVVRASDDGVAYRYVVDGTDAYTVTKEPVSFAVPDKADAWLLPYSAAYENKWAATTSDGAAAGDFGFPALFRSGGTYALFTESDVTGTYAGSHLTHQAGSPAYGLSLYDGKPVNATGSLTTPWRVEIVGSAATVVQSTLVDDLAPPSKVQDTSWIRPGMSSWSWLAAGASEQAQGDLATQERFVDLAAKEGWPYMLVDAGWDAAWMPTLIRYAAARGVSINAWFASGELWTDAQMTTWFQRLRDWGVTGVKVDYMNSDSQDTFAWYDRILAMTAEYHLMIDFHGSTIPHGIQRTWPQIMSYEAVRGEENGRDVTVNTILPFTRNVVGSMDYTPTIFTNNTQISKAQELAETIVYESGWQHPADGPAAYAAQPAAADLLANVPATWADTRYVAGQPGSSAVLARRSGANWFIGGLSGGDATTMSVPLNVLGQGRWLIDLVTDKGSSLVHQTLTRTSAGVLSVPVAAHGGFALEACPATPGRTTCYAPVPAVTGTSVLVDTDKTDVDTGDLVTVQGIFVVRTNGPARDISMTVDLPATWSLVSGGPVTRKTLADGKSINGSWTVRVGAGGPRGAVELPVTATFTTPSGRVIKSADATTVQVALIPPKGDAYLSDQQFLTATADWGNVQRDTDLGGNPIKLGTAAQTYPKGIVANANATVSVFLGGQCTSFTAQVGVTPDGDHPEEGSVTFQAFDGNGNALAPAVGSTTAPITLASGAVPFQVATDGVQQLVLKIGDAGNGINNDHGAFADAVLHCNG
jgi:alpha-glucosidase